MREFFLPRRFQRKTLTRIEQANTILAEYAGQGFVLTLRQLFYQFVARQLVENTQQNYDNLGDTMTNARNAGLVDWDLIEVIADSSRVLNGTRRNREPLCFNGVVNRADFVFAFFNHLIERCEVLL
jgi:hypothetical protein